ncbi:MAG TPA: hypothetical protein VMW29_02700 [Candidatus Bathyarchaeia archaeon]|nr:hypothetical protein [Candidatus Bathyarchaeia archaeon]
MDDRQNKTSIILGKDIFLNSLDRFRNILITGVSGVGVATYLLDLITQDIQAKRPIILFNHYGDLVNRVYEQVSPELQKKIAYIDVGNADYPVGLNMFEPKEEKDKREICNTVINFMYDLYDPNRTGVIGPRFEHAVRNAMLTIMYGGKASFIELVRCLTDASYVQNILPKVQDEIVRNYWTKQIAQTSDFHKSEVLDYIVSKLGPFITDKKMRYILGQTKSTVDLEQLIKEGKTIIFDFGKLSGDIDAIKIISAILLIKLTQVLRSRDETKNKVALYFDEINLWPSNSIIELLKESKRMGINLTITTGRIAELSQVLRRELLKVGTLVSFRLDTKDAQIIVPEFHASISIDTLCMLKKYHVYIKYLKDGNPIATPEAINLEKNISSGGYKSTKIINKIKQDLHKRYGTHFQEVEKDIKKRI